MDKEQIPLRPSRDPEVLAKQLEQALREPGDVRYQAYVAQLVKDCCVSIYDGDPSAPDQSLAMLRGALHLGERLDDSSEAAIWLRATARFLEVAQEALAPRLTVDALVHRERADTEHEILEVLLRAGSTALRRGEIADHWKAPTPPPTDVRIGQVLARLHDEGIVVRMKQRARGGSDVAFYRLSRLGVELCQRLRLASAPDTRIAKPVFYEKLWLAVMSDTSQPLYLTTFDDPTSGRRSKEFHDRLLANLANIRRPIEWIHTASPYFDKLSSLSTGHIHLHPLSGKPQDRTPTIQVLDDGGLMYPVAGKGQVTGRDVARQAWEDQKQAQPAA